jgi:hypothetical protein
MDKFYPEVFKRLTTKYIRCAEKIKNNITGAI